MPGQQKRDAQRAFVTQLQCIAAALQGAAGF
jgi:hypothetical protein